MGQKRGLPLSHSRAGKRSAGRIGNITEVFFDPERSTAAVVSLLSFNRRGQSQIGGIYWIEPRWQDIESGRAALRVIVAVLCLAVMLGGRVWQ